MLQFTDKGIYCPKGDFYIDPWQPVHRAIITHAHSDHARPGSDHYLSHPLSIPVLKWRLGDIDAQPLDWNQTLSLNGVQVSLHPAGHIIGSSQVRIDAGEGIWVVSGDYKTENDHLSGQFEAIPCDVFITESTFGLPIYDWKPQQEIFYDIQNWVLRNREGNKNSVLIGYSLGKAQRLIQCLAELRLPIYVHGAIWNIHELLRQAGVQLPELIRITPDMKKEQFTGAIIVAPPGAEGSAWMKRFLPYSVGVCSGWMQVRGNKRRRNADAGFALSDHADWKGLLEAIRATGARKIFSTHGFQAQISRYLKEQGYDAAEVKTAYGDEEEAREEVKESEALS